MKLALCVAGVKRATRSIYIQRELGVDAGPEFIWTLPAGKQGLSSNKIILHARSCSFEALAIIYGWCPWGLEAFPCCPLNGTETALACRET